MPEGWLLAKAPRRLMTASWRGSGRGWLGVGEEEDVVDGWAALERMGESGRVYSARRWSRRSRARGVGPAAG